MTCRLAWCDGTHDHDDGGEIGGPAGFWHNSAARLVRVAEKVGNYGVTPAEQLVVSLSLWEYDEVPLDQSAEPPVIELDDKVLSLGEARSLADALSTLVSLAVVR